MNKNIFIGVIITSAISWAIVDIILMIGGYLNNIQITPYIVTEFWLVYMITSIIVSMLVDHINNYLKKKNGDCANEAENK